MATKVELGQEWNFLKKVDYTSGSRTAFSVIEKKHGMINKFVGEGERSVGETGISQVFIMHSIPVS